MVADPQPLFTLLQLIDEMPLATPPRRGRPCVYADRVILKALLVMIVRQLPTVGSLLAVLAEPTAEMTHVRAQLTDEHGRFPSRRTWERRLDRIVDDLPTLIRVLGAYLLALLQPWPRGGRAVAIDSTVLAARGGVWHKKDREAGVVPHSSIDIEAAWTKSGWHGWVYGWKLHVVVTVSETAWLPLAGTLTAANVADNKEAPALLGDLPEAVLAILGDQHYTDPDLAALATGSNRLLITTKRGAYPHTDDGVEVRRIFHQLRSHAIENFNCQFKATFNCLGQVPTRGLRATTRYVLGAVLLYQLTLWHHQRLERDLRVGVKSFVLAA
jgi:hypothetical protein